MREENRSTRGKTSHRLEDQQIQFTYDTECGNRTRATLVAGKCSHHKANPATNTNNNRLNVQVTGHFHPYLVKLETVTAKVKVHLHISLYSNLNFWV